MTSFSLIDHFLLSDQLYSVSNVCVVHDVDNCSDHDPVLLHLDIHVNRVSYTKRQYTAHPSWARAQDIHVDSYKCALQSMLKNISIPYSALQCQDVFFVEITNILPVWISMLHSSLRHAQNLLRPPYPSPDRVESQDAFLDGRSLLLPSETSLSSGITFGQSLVNLIMVWLQTICERPVHAIMLLLDRFAEMRQK